MVICPCSRDPSWLFFLEERCDLAQGVAVTADQGMTAGWKDDGPAAMHAGGNIPRPTGRAEPIVFGADCQDRAGDLLDWIRLARGGRLNIEVHPRYARAYRQNVLKSLPQARFLAGLGGAHKGAVCAEHHPGHYARRN